MVNHDRLAPTHGNLTRAPPRVDSEHLTPPRPITPTAGPGALAGTSDPHARAPSHCYRTAGEVAHPPTAAHSSDRSSFRPHRGHRTSPDDGMTLPMNSKTVTFIVFSFRTLSNTHLATPLRRHGWFGCNTRRMGSQSNVSGGSPASNGGTAGCLNERLLYYIFLPTLASMTLIRHTPCVGGLALLPRI
jgi:hypothetical protein